MLLRWAEGWSERRPPVGRRRGQDLVLRPALPSRSSARFKTQTPAAPASQGSVPAQARGPEEEDDGDRFGPRQQVGGVGRCAESGASPDTPPGVWTNPGLSSMATAETHSGRRLVFEVVAAKACQPGAGGYVVWPSLHASGRDRGGVCGPREADGRPRWGWALSDLLRARREQEGGGDGSSSLRASASPASGLRSPWTLGLRLADGRPRLPQPLSACKTLPCGDPAEGPGAVSLENPDRNTSVCFLFKNVNDFTVFI